MKLFAFSAIFLSVAIFAVGCAATADGGDSNESAASEGADLTSQGTTSVLVGTFSLNGTNSQTPFHSITLNADKTFKATGGCPQSGPGPHCFAITAISGEWATKKSASGAAQLELTDSAGQATTYFYSLKSDQLSLSKAAGGAAALFDKSLDHLTKLKMMDVCADKFDNTLGECPEEFPCEQDGPTGNTQRCLPPI